MYDMWAAAREVIPAEPDASAKTGGAKPAGLVTELVEASGALFPRARGRFKGGCAATPRTHRSDAVLQRAVGRGV